MEDFGPALIQLGRPEDARRDNESTELCFRLSSFSVETFT